MSITGTNAGDFAQENNCGNVVASGAYCKIKLTFTPSGQGGRNASLLISDDGGGSPQTVPLAGRGTP
jgi:two-component sensor histidine kinase